MKNTGSVLIVILTLIATILHAQPTQQIRGTILDGALQKPLASATITLLAAQSATQSNPANKTTVTDSNGNFTFRAVPIGRQTIIITHIG